MNERIANRIRGVIFGQALGDALGEGVEFLSKPQIEQYYPKGLKEPLQDLRWLRWTDDTAQMLCILDSLLSQKRVGVLNIAAHFHHWAETDGRRIGNTVFSVVHDTDFLENPHAVAQRFWEKSGRYAAANGAVMRTSGLGIWEYPFPDKVKYNAEEVCKITHSDPRCLGSCVAVSLAISYLLRGVSDIPALIKGIAAEVAEYDPNIQEYFDLAGTSLSALDLDEGTNPGEADRIGYTLKAMGAGFWALQYAESWDDGVLKILEEGGDADTNAAVAGALLGARFGGDSISQTWVEKLRNVGELERRAQEVIAVAQQWS